MILMMPNERAEYHHDQYGHVRVLLVSDGRVSFESMAETVTGGTPKTWAEPVEQFDDQTDPVDQTLAVSAESLTSE